MNKTRHARARILKGQRKLPFPIPQTVQRFLAMIVRAVGKNRGGKSRVAKHLDVTPSTVGRWLKSQRVPRATTVQVLIDNLRKIA